MRISFHGACREVTGSCYLIETTKTKFLVDCGMFQGEKFSSEHNLENFKFNSAEVDFVLLTHAHLDHCGRLPKLYSDGFRGEIYSTAATRDLTEVVLQDSAHVILQEAERENQKPLYLEEDVIDVMNLFVTQPYGKKLDLTPEISICLRDAGHILGSCIFEVWIKEGHQVKKIVFSGDLGNPPAPLVRDTEFVDEADLVFVESTYGGRIHEPKEMREQLLRQAVVKTVSHQGVLLIPAFALERTQEVLYELNDLVERRQMAPVPIFVDSPMAIKATDVYKKYVDVYDEQSRQFIESGDDLFNFSGLQYAPTMRQSYGIDNIKSPKVILAGSGMCNGGRIPRHLKRYLGDPKSHLLIISYQAQGSPGRHLLEGDKEVKLEGEWIKVRAEVSAIGSYSSHADQPTIINWVAAIDKIKPQQAFVVHGEEQENGEVAKALKDKLGINTIIPEYGKVYEF